MIYHGAPLTADTPVEADARAYYAAHAKTIPSAPAEPPVWDGDAGAFVLRQPLTDPFPDLIDWEVIERTVAAHIQTLLNNGASRLRMRIRFGMQLINSARYRRLSAALYLEPNLRPEGAPGRQLGTFLGLPVFQHPSDHAGIQVQAIRNDVSIDHGVELR